MKKKRNQIAIGVCAFFIVVVVCCIISQARVQIQQGVGFGRYAYTSKDSVMLVNRHMGLINFKQFKALVTEKIPGYLDEQVIIQGDSVFFRTTNNLDYFFGQTGGNNWITQYKNLPIHIVNGGFKAKLQTIDTVQYVYLPYQVLANVAKIGESSLQPDEVVDNGQRQTIKDPSKLPDSKVQGNKIQTEGVVRQNVMDILSDHPNIGQREQMEVLWKYAKSHWNYVNDPSAETDTWRSASETINDYYFVNGKCYSGDCDDFAILMASFARQIGYSSHMVAAYNQSGGHAYAEFHEKGGWTPLDWFSNRFGGQPFQGDHKVIYDNP